MIATALLATALMMGILCQEDIPEHSEITLTVKNVFANTIRKYTAPLVYRGVLFGAMTKLQEIDSSFKFMTIENVDYGPYLVSVNGVAGNFNERTYWELLGQCENGNITRADVGIGCYIPRPNEHIILNFTTWPAH